MRNLINNTNKGIQVMGSDYLNMELIVRGRAYSMALYRRCSDTEGPWRLDKLKNASGKEPSASIYDIAYAVIDNRKDLLAEGAVVKI